MGTGQMGMMLAATLADNRLHFHVERSAVTDHRKASDRKSSMGVNGASVTYGFPPLDLGRMALIPAVTEFAELARWFAAGWGGLG